MLTAAGATAALAENGLAAVAKVTADPGAFDIVLMDIQMPELDGIGATERIRRLRSADDLPVLAMSAHSADDERQRCADAGMNGFLSKPVTSAALIAAVERWVGPPGAGGRKL